MWHTTDGDIVLYKPQNAKTFTETVNFTHTNSIFRVLHLLPNMSDNFSNHPNQQDLQTAVFLFWSSNLPHKSYLGTYERPAFWGGRGHWFWYITYRALVLVYHFNPPRLNGCNISKYVWTVSGHWTEAKRWSGGSRQVFGLRLGLRIIIAIMAPPLFRLQPFFGRFTSALSVAFVYWQRTHTKTQIPNDKYTPTNTKTPKDKYTKISFPLLHCCHYEQQQNIVICKQKVYRQWIEQHLR